MPLLVFGALCLTLCATGLVVTFLALLAKRSVRSVSGRQREEGEMQATCRTRDEAEEQLPAGPSAERALVSLSPRPQASQLQHWNPRLHSLLGHSLAMGF